MDKKRPSPLLSKGQGILLLNTGSPEALSKKAIRKYLCTFLDDPKVMNVPSLIRKALVRGIIAPLRAGKSLKKYQHVWSKEGPLLRLLTSDLARKMSALSEGLVLYAMRYEEGSIQRAYEAFQTAGIHEVFLLPLYPQYAMSSYESALEYAHECHRKLALPFKVHDVAPYYKHPEYVELLIDFILRYHSKGGGHLLLSYHGIPMSHVRRYQGIPERDYQAHCQEMTEALLSDPRIRSLGLSSEVCYQSRFGLHKWLSPATSDRLKALPKEGVKEVSVLCPSFVCDCLETIEEIGVEGKKSFLGAGGERITLIPCPNAEEETARALLTICLEQDTAEEHFREKNSSDQTSQNKEPVL